jgi:hypothetical protein
MSIEPIADELVHFIRATFETVDQLRILLLLQASPERVWYPAVISSYLHTQPDVVESSLDILCRKGCVAHPDDSGPRYRYQPANAKMAQLLNAVAELDRTRPVTLIRLIYQHA